MYFSPSTMGFYCHEVHGDDMPGDAKAITDDLYQSLQGWAIQVVDGLPARKPAEPVDPTPVLISAIQAELDKGAQAHNYDSIASAITYRGDPNPKFAAEAEAFFLWRSAVWTKAYEVLATGDIPSIPEAIALMPPLSITYPESQ